MTALVQCMSHSPLMAFTRPPEAIDQAVSEAMRDARKGVAAFDPELTILFFPDHFNGFFYDNMPVYCIGTQAYAIGDYKTRAGPINVPETLAESCAGLVLKAGYDVSVSYRMTVDHGVAQPLEILFGGISQPSVIPVFINSVATPLSPIERIVGFGRAIGEFVRESGKRVLIIGSGGLSHDPPLPRLSESPPQVREKLIDGRNPSAEARDARQTRVIESGRKFAQAGAEAAGIMPLNPDWDRAILSHLAAADFNGLKTMSPQDMARHGGNSAHEVRTWIAAFSALQAFGPYSVTSEFYAPINEWIAGFGLMSAEPA